MLDSNRDLFPKDEKANKKDNWHNMPIVIGGSDGGKGKEDDIYVNSKGFEIHRIHNNDPDHYYAAEATSRGTLNVYADLGTEDPTPTGTASIGEVPEAPSLEAILKHSSAFPAQDRGGTMDGFNDPIFTLMTLGAFSGVTKVAAGEAGGAFYSVAFETKLATTSYPGVYRGSHFLEANKALSAAMASNARFASDITKLGIKIPTSSSGSILGKSPANWVWHHDINPGMMQLVPKAQHTVGSPFWKTLHPNGVGGFSIWGK